MKKVCTKKEGDKEQVVKLISSLFK